MSINLVSGPRSREGGKGRAGRALFRVHYSANLECLLIPLICGPPVLISDIFTDYRKWKVRIIRVWHSAFILPTAITLRSTRLDKSGQYL